MRFNLSKDGEENIFQMQFAYNSGLSINIDVDARTNDSRYNTSGKFKLGDTDKKVMLDKAIKLIEKKLGSFYKPMYCAIFRWNSILKIKEVVGAERFKEEVLQQN
jgi:hypothetical protein